MAPWASRWCRVQDAGAPPNRRSGFTLPEFATGIGRPLPVDECQLSDFYLPEGGVCLEYWGAGEHSGSPFARRAMRRAELGVANRLDR